MKHIGILLLVATLMGCATTNQETTGTWVGGAAGATLGALAGRAIGGKNATWIGGIVGGLAGGAIGKNIGRHMDQQDATMAMQAVNRTPTGQTSSWQNPDTGYQYDVTPTRTYQESGRYCREVTIGEAKIGGKREEVYGTACRQPDGSWEMQ